MESFYTLSLLKLTETVNDYKLKIVAKTKLAKIGVQMYEAFPSMRVPWYHP
jgi:hypothetical protein